MWFGEMRIEAYPGATWNIIQKIKEANEGKRILKLYPQYENVNQDNSVKTKIGYYVNVLYAYMMDCVLEEHPILKNKYREIWDQNVNTQNQYPYNKTNEEFLVRYKEYLRKAENPETEELIKRDLELNAIQRKKEKEEQDRKLRKQAEEEARKRKAEQEWAERQAAFQLQQDLASGKRVVCPYCKSTNTEKISTMSRAVSVSLVGAASGKIGKQWHCNSCGSNF